MRPRPRESQSYPSVDKFRNLLLPKDFNLRRRNKKQTPLWIIVATGLSVGAVLLILVGCVFFNLQSINQTIPQWIGDVFQSEVTLEPIRWQGVNFSSQKLHLLGKEDALINEATASPLEITWNWRALLVGKIHIHDISIGDMKVDFSSTHNPQLRDNKSENSHFLLDRTTISRAKISYKNILAEGMKMNLAPSSSTGWQIHGSNGHLRVPKLPELQIKSFYCISENGRLDLVDSVLDLNGMGHITAKGQSGENASLQVNWSGVPADKLIGDPFGKYISGDTSGTCDLDAHGRATGNFLFSNAKLTGISGLREIASFTGISMLQEPVLDNISANFDYKDEAVGFTNIQIENRGLFKLEGSLFISPEGNLRGNLLLGLGEGLLATLPGAREGVFQNQKNGYYWTPVNLGGTLSMPTEDLSSRLAPYVFGRALINQGSKIIEKVPENAVDQVKDVINMFLPFGR